jgi:hypothetical protein
VEPFAVGFMILVGTAALIGAVVGAIGGAITWRAGANLFVGAVVTACALVLVLIAEGEGRLVWLRAKLTWGVPSMAFTFLAALASARWLTFSTTLGRRGTATVGFIIALCLGLLSLRLFGLSLRAPLLAAGVAGVCLIAVWMGDRRRVGQ